MRWAIAPLVAGGAIDAGCGMIAAADAVEPVDFVARSSARASRLGKIVERERSRPKSGRRRGPLRIRGRAGDGLYWSLARGRRVAAVAGAISHGAGDRDRRRREIGPGDRFDLVVANRRAATASADACSTPGSTAPRRRDLQLVHWTAGGRSHWIDAADIDRPAPVESGMAWPVAAGSPPASAIAVHPILRFARFHGGVDFGASWGSPIVAAADGQVIGAGWAGGYGRQVRIAHGGGIVTSYSHMSRSSPSRAASSATAS